MVGRERDAMRIHEGVYVSKFAEREKKKVRDFYFGYPIPKAPPPVMVEQEKKKGTENPERDATMKIGTCLMR